jgi:branched-chain amino acid aminotransferase
MSPCKIALLDSSGLHPADYQAESLADAARFEPHDGVYTVTNTYPRMQVLKLDAHLDRLEDSARRAAIPLRLDRPRLRAALRQMIEQSAFGEVRFRITVPRESPERLILSIEPFHRHPPEIYSTGVRCITLPDSARQNAAVKSTGWMHDREQFQLPAGIYTGLLLDHEGHILEGTSSNFYAVLEGQLWTAGTGALPGIAQQIVLEVVPPILPIRRDAPRQQDIPRMAEAFITSSSRGIVPVIEIDGIIIGGGQPGPKTRALQDAYAAWVSAHLEAL